MTISTPFGPVWATTDYSGALTELRFGPPVRPPHSMESHAVSVQLYDYFAGKRKSFDIVLAPEGTDFQKRVWAELVRIPFGETISYGELAERVGSKGGARAVGRANATNPIAILIPCHRVIGKDGSLTGYAYGVELKRSLLELEWARS